MALTCFVGEILFIQLKRRVRVLAKFINLENHEFNTTLPTKKTMYNFLIMLNFFHKSFSSRYQIGGLVLSIYFFDQIIRVNSISSLVNLKPTSIEEGFCEHRFVLLLVESSFVVEYLVLFGHHSDYSNVVINVLIGHI